MSSSEKLIIPELCHTCINYSAEYDYCKSLAKPNLEYFPAWQEHETKYYICGFYEGRCGE